MRKLICSVLSAAMLSSLIVLPVSAEGNTETVSYTYSAGEGKTYTREMEKLGRGLVAIKTDGGVYLSWRLLDSEDHIFGSADSNVSFNIYRNNQKIATVTDKTNYTDTKGSTSYTYSVAPVVNEKEGAKETAIMNMDNSYFDIPLEVPETETIDYIANGSAATIDYSFSPADCSTGDLDGDGEYEIIVKWTSAEKDVGSPGSPAYSGTVRFAAYKLDGTKMWDKDINLGKNVYSSAHTVQFLVYDFDGDGKAEMMCQTSLGSKDAKDKYVSKAANPQTNPDIYNISDDENAAADFRSEGWGLISTGQEFLTVFDGETGAAVDTIDLPTPRGVSSTEWGDPSPTTGNRVNRFMASVAYLDGEKPYAVYSRGYYFAKNAADVNADRQRTSIAGICYENKRLNAKYRFDTNKNYPGYVSGDEKYAGNGNHNCTVADVDNDGKDEYITGALCMEVDDNDKFRPRWCTFLEHGDALHIGDYDPTHKGLEFFTVHEDGFSVMGQKGYNHYTNTELDYGMSVIDADTGEILFHEGNDNDTGRGIMANIGAGGYYQIFAHAQSKEAPTGATKFDAGPYIANGNGSFTKATAFSSMAQNFRVFWDGDLYDEILDGTAITSWNNSKSKFDTLIDTKYYDCVQINGTKANPAIQADLFGDWREEVVYPLSDGTALRVFSTTDTSDYKVKTLMHDPVYRSGVAAEQTAYNQPPHIGFYLAEEAMRGAITELKVTSTKTEYAVGENFDKSTLTVKATYKNGTTDTIDNFSVSGFNSSETGKQTLTISYMNAQTELEVEVISNFKVDSEGYITSYTGALTTETIPASINGVEIKGVRKNALSGSGIKSLYVYEDLDFENASLYTGTTVYCFEGSTAHTYAERNYLNYVIMTAEKNYTNVTVDDSAYSGYANNAAIVYQHEKTAWTTKISPLTYIAYARSNSDGGDGQTGVYKTYSSDRGSNVLEARGGRYSTANRHACILLDEASRLKDLNEYTFSFDFAIPSNTKNMTIAILSSSDGKFSNASNSTTDAKTIYALRADDNIIISGQWYYYELSYNNGTYTQSVTNSSGYKRTLSLNTEASPSSIAFPCDGTGKNNEYVSAYLDNITISAPMVSEYTIKLTDNDGGAISGASVSIDGIAAGKTASDGTLTATVEGGRHTLIASHDDYYELETSFTAYSEVQSKTFTMEAPNPQADKPQISVADLSVGKQVTITSTVPNAVIRYILTSDNDEPGEHSEIYTGPFTVYESTTVKAIVYAEGYEPSEVASRSITIAKPYAAAPEIVILNGEDKKLVDLSTKTEGADIYYTTDGSVPTPASNKFSDEIEVTGKMVIKAIAVKNGYIDSSVSSADINVSKASTPTADVAAGEVTAGTLVTLTTETAGADIYYTTDGSAPSKSSTKYTGSIVLTENATIKAIAVKAGYKTSDVFERAYTVKAASGDKMTISIGSACAATGETVSIPVYLITSEEDMMEYQMTIDYNSKILRYDSITPGSGYSAYSLRATDTNYEIQVKSTDWIEGEHLFTLNFTVLDTAAEGTYSIALDEFDDIRIDRVSYDIDELNVSNGTITVKKPLANVSTAITDKNGSDLTSGSTTDEITASIIVDNPDTITLPDENKVHALIAVYDSTGVLEFLNDSAVYVSELKSKAVSETVKIPDGITIGSVKVFIWDGLNSMTPISSVN